MASQTQQYAEGHTAEYRRDIDGLRAVAVLLVVIFHAFPQSLSGGFVGVDIFFVISGFLISSNILRSLEEQRFSFLDFYSRRIRRIFPALLVVLLACISVGWFVLYADEYRLLGKHVAAGSAFISNILLWTEAGYFDTAGIRKPLLHLWSLGIEEQFYIAYPVILYLSFKRKAYLGIILACITLCSLAFSLITTPLDPVQAFYSPASRVWQLLVGTGVALGYRSHNGIAGRSGSICSSIGIALLAYAALTFFEHAEYPGIRAVIPTVGAALIIMSSPVVRFNRSVLGHRFLVAVGLISYPLYLWHWPLLSFARILGHSGPGSNALLLATSFVLAAITYTLVEIPIRFRKAVSVPLLASGMGVLCATGVVLATLDGVPSRSINSAFIDSTLSTPIPSTLPNLQPCPQEISDPKLGLAYCSLSREGPPVNALVGDSHAEDKFLGVGLIDSSTTWLLLGSNSAPPLSNVDIGNTEEKNKKVIEYLTKTPSIKLVVLSFFGYYMTDTTIAADHHQTRTGPATMRITSKLYPNKNKIELFELGLAGSVSALEKAGKSVILVIDTPELPFFPQDCARIGWDKPECSLNKATVYQRQEPLRRIFRSITNKHSGVRIFDPLPILCSRDVCNLAINGSSLFRDSHHLSNFGSVYWARNFLAWLRRES
jgi:peptidoglycan/LPS O-acetylase OafA/YrhL